MKYDNMTFILEEDHSFKMTVPLRDFAPGTVMLNNIAEAVMGSRRMKKIVKATSLVDMRLSNNPFECDCDMLWLNDWLTNNSGRAVIRDYREVKCRDGHLLYRLDAVKMGCFPKELTVWEKILTRSSAFVILGVAVATIFISRRWKEVKWFMYLHFDVLDKNDEDEDLEIVEADALLSYRYKYICYNLFKLSRNALVCVASWLRMQIMKAYVNL